MPDMGSAFSGRRLLLFFIPIYIIILSCLFLHKALPFYWSQPDPVYLHYFNGINLASGNLEVGNTDNPGTTVQCFDAAVVFTKHLFSFSGTPLYQDAIINSESYLFTCSVLLILLFVCINYFTGAYIFCHTGSIGLSVLFQLVPLININIMQRAAMPEPESFIILVAPLLMAYLFVNAPENKMNANKPLTNKTVILFAVLSGFLIATKYTCAPVILLVLFILQKNKHRLLYLAATIVSFLLFIIPALPQISKMFNWVWALLTHDGIYGTGESRVINPTLYAHNIKSIFTTGFIFPSFYVTITIAFLIALVNWIRKKNTIPFFCATTGIWLSITVSILVVAKHYDSHYLIFAECCFPFGLIVSYKIFSASFNYTNTSYIKYKKEILYSAFAILVVFLIVEKVRYTPSIYTKPLNVNGYTDKHKALPLIIATKVGTECECKEYALFFGNLFTGSLQGKYTEFLKKTYPDTYLSLYGTEGITSWDKTMSIPEFSANHKKMTIYMNGYSDTAQVRFAHEFCTGNGNEQTREQSIYRDAKTQQSVYLIDTKKE